MQVEKVKQISIRELKIRQISEEYLKIQENTEFLTHVTRYVSKRQRLQCRQQNILVDMKSVASLMVQISYLLFTCHVKKTNIFISDRICYLYPHKKQLYTQICMEYILQKQFFTMTSQEQNVLLHYFKKYQFTGLVNQYNCLLSNIINKLLDLVKAQKQRVKHPQEKIYLKQFFTLQQVVMTFLYPKLLDIKHPRIIILTLQETEIFRQNSLLVKAMNNSIFSSIRNNPNKNIFLEISKMQKNLISVKNIKNVQAQIEETQKIIDDFFFMLLRCKIVTIQQSLNLQVVQGTNEVKDKQLFINKYQNMNKNSKKPQLGQIQNVSSPDQKYVCKIIIYQKPFIEFNEKLMQSIVQEALNNYVRLLQQQPQNKNKPISHKNQFFIQFFSTKGLIVVKYITPIELNIENTDRIMFQSNNIGYHWSNVAMEVIQKTQSKQAKKKQRFLALKTVSYINYSQNPLFKILIMIDLVMLCAKIAQPQMRKNILKSEDFIKMQQISKKVDHMIKIFIKKIERYYSLINQNDQKR